VTTPPASEHTPTPSLRRRVTRTVLAVIAVLLLVVGVAIDLALGVQLRRDVHDRRTAPCGQDPHFGRNVGRVVQEHHQIPRRTLS
jgi:hypothetical protein